jgi:digeranylgeranylglycerophospholipid reductase
VGRPPIQPLHDVIVAGAGPAGSRMARDLARRGFDVLVLEEHRLVGAPCHCSGLVTPRTIELADVGQEVVRNTIRGAIIHAPGVRPVTIGGDRIHAYVIDRTELDRRLWTQAEAAGATLLPRTRLMSFSLTDTHVVAHVRSEGRPARLRARMLVGADGALSSVAWQIRGTRPTGIVAGLGAVAGYDGNPLDDHVEVFLDPHSAPGWFGWTIPLLEGLARLGTGSANGIKPRESFARLQSTFPSTFGAARVHSHTGGLIALWEPTPMVADRVMLVGDAARQVKPTSGGGIHAALEAAGLAASVAADALVNGDLTERGLGAYPRRWHRSRGRELRRQHDMRRVFARLTADDLATLVPLLAEPELRAAIDAEGDIDYASRMVRRIGRHRPQLLLKLLARPRFPLAWLWGS